MAAEPRRRPRRFGSIRARATTGAVLVVAVVLTVGAVLQIRVVERHLVDAAERSAEVLAIEVAERARLGALPATIPVADDDTQLVQVVDSSGGQVAASENVETRAPIVDLRPEPPDDDAPSEGVEYEVTAATRGDLAVDDGGRWRVVAVQAGTDDGIVTVYAGTSLEEVESTIATLRRSLLVGIPVLVGIVGLMTLVVVRRALRPVAVMRADLGEITDRRLDRRVSEPTSDDEIADLAEAMNDLLDRLQRAAVRERRFIGDASHELRTPLAALHTELDVALAHPDRTDWESAVRAALDDTRRVEALATDLLMLAQVDGETSTGPGAIVDLGEVVADEVEHRPRVDGVSVRAQLAGDVLVLGHAHQLARLVRNLLDNAERHAAATVTVRTRRDGADAVLEVADDGAGIPAAAREQVFERFTRLDDARARDDGGAGLGLAIVREVARAHGGDVTILGPPGATFVVRIPLAAAPTPGSG